MHEKDTKSQTVKKNVFTGFLANFYSLLTCKTLPLRSRYCNNFHKNILYRPGIVVNYDGCFIDTTKGAMTAGTGIVTVAEAVIYQLTFTAK
jgi:hypothetical protein